MPRYKVAFECKIDDNRRIISLRKGILSLRLFKPTHCRAEGAPVTEKHESAPAQKKSSTAAKPPVERAAVATSKNSIPKPVAKKAAATPSAVNEKTTATKRPARNAAGSASRVNRSVSGGHAPKKQPPSKERASVAPSPSEIADIPASADSVAPSADRSDRIASNTTAQTDASVLENPSPMAQIAIDQATAELNGTDDAISEPPKDTLSEPGEVEPIAEPDDGDMDTMCNRLMALQQKVRAAGIPVVILFEGWHASGKGTYLSKLIKGLDPRGYQVYPVRKPTAEDCAYPDMRRYSVHLPAKGDISLFCGSWYREVSNACFESKAARKRINQAYDEIVSLESQLVSDGTLLIKFFLHIPRKEQKARLKELESHKSTRWRVTKEDWEQNEQYDEHLRLYDAMIARTHFEGAVWHVLRGDNRQTCIRQIYDTVLEDFENALKAREAGDRTWDTPYLQHLESISTVTFPQLESFDPDQALSDPYKPAIDKAQKQLSKLQNELYRRGVSMVIGFEGWDAAGKGGAIRRLTSALDARGFDVVPISAPTALEQAHHHLWRFWNTLPRDGNIAVFDRTWYGRVLVERVEGFCTETQWKRAYEEINRFEAEIAAHGTIIVKFWLHIDQATQLTRFNDRQSAPDKQWKITEDDWRNREKWPLYAVAVNDMLQKTNTAAAQWTVVEANNKQFARLKVLQTVIGAIEDKLCAE
jgi:polyphosphate:AMP phosphotransferase